MEKGKGSSRSYIQDRMSYAIGAQGNVPWSATSLITNDSILRRGFKKRRLMNAVTLSRYTANSRAPQSAQAHRATQLDLDLDLDRVWC